MSADPQKSSIVNEQGLLINIKQEEPDDNQNFIHIDKKEELQEITSIHRQIEVLRTMLDQERRTKEKQIELMETMLGRERALHDQEMSLYERKFAEQEKLYNEDIALQKRILEEERAVHQKKTALYEKTIKDSSCVWKKLEQQVAKIGRNVETLLGQQAQPNASHPTRFPRNSQESAPITHPDPHRPQHPERVNEFANDMCFMQGQANNRAWIAGHQQSIAHSDQGAYLKTSFVAHQVDFVPARAEPMLSLHAASEILVHEQPKRDEPLSRFVVRMRLVAQRGGIPDHKALHWTIDKLPYHVRHSLFVWISNATWENLVQTLEWMERSQRGQVIQVHPHTFRRGTKRQGRAIGWNTSTPKRFREL